MILLDLLSLDIFPSTHLGHMFGSSRLVGEAVRARPMEPARPRTPNLWILCKIFFIEFVLESNYLVE